MENPTGSVNSFSVLIKHRNESPSLRYKLLRTVAVCFLWLCFGTFSEITGPVIPQLIAQTQSQYALIALSLSMRGAGHAFGGIIGGLTVDRWFRHIDIAIAVILLLYTAVGVWSAYVENITLLFIVFLLQGSIETWLQTAAYRITLKLWQGRSAGPLHVLQIGYGVGSIVAPQLVAPFLDPHFSGGVIRAGYDSPCASNNSLVQTGPTTETPQYPADFVNAYWILSGLGLLVSVIFILYHIHGKVYDVHVDTDSSSSMMQAKSLIESLQPRTCSPTHPTYAGLIIIMLFFYYAMSIPLLRAFSKFIFSYARDGPCLTIKDSAMLESAYFIAVTVGRLCAFLASSVIHMKYILQVEVLGVLGCTLMLFFNNSNLTTLWIFCTALGFFTGPIIPSAFAWANRYIEITSTAQIIPQIGAAFGDVLVMMGIGYGYQHDGPYVLWSYQLGLAIGMCVVTWIMQTLGSLHGDRYKQEEKSP